MSIRHSSSVLASFGAVVMLALSQSAGATVFWTDWTSRVLGDPGSAQGTIVAGPSSVSVTYAGDVASPTQVSGGTNFFSPIYAAYTGVVNPPPGSDVIALDSASSVNTLTFSSAVVNPYMALVSMGQSGLAVRYDFVNAPFVIVDVGNGHFGNGTLAQLPGDVLEGREGHGIIQFIGSYNSISWSVTPAEFWHGFTIGIESVAVPVPGSLVLVLAGFAALAGRLRRKL